MLSYVLLDWSFSIVSPFTLIFLIRGGGVAEEWLIILQLFICA